MVSSSVIGSSKVSSIGSIEASEVGRLTYLPTSENFENYDLRGVGVYQIERGIESIEMRLNSEINNLKHLRMLVKLLSKKLDLINESNEVGLPTSVLAELESELEWVKKKVKVGHEWKPFVKGRCLSIDAKTGYKIKSSDYLKYMNERI